MDDQLKPENETEYQRQSFVFEEYSQGDWCFWGYKKTSSSCEKLKLTTSLKSKTNSKSGKTQRKTKVISEPYYWKIFWLEASNNLRIRET